MDSLTHTYTDLDAYCHAHSHVVACNNNFHIATMYLFSLDSHCVSHLLLYILIIFFSILQVYGKSFSCVSASPFLSPLCCLQPPSISQCFMYITQKLSSAPSAAQISGVFLRHCVKKRWSAMGTLQILTSQPAIVDTQYLKSLKTHFSFQEFR